MFSDPTSPAPGAPERASNPEIFQLLPRREPSTSSNRMCMLANMVASQSDHVTQNRVSISVLLIIRF